MEMEVDSVVDRADTTYDEFRNNAQVEKQIAELHGGEI